MANKYWVGGDATLPNDWGTAANWSPTGVPIASDEVFILDSEIPIDGSDQSAVLIGNLYVGVGMTANIGSSTNYLKLAFQAGSKITIDGETKNQEIWIDNAGANNTTMEVSSFGEVAASNLATKGIHFKNTGTGTITNLTNTAGALTVESGSGTISSIVASSGQTFVSSGVTLLSFRSIGSGAVVTLESVPTTSLNVVTGNVEVNFGAAIGNVSVFGGVLSWNSGQNITTNLTIFGGRFDASRAIRQPVINAIEIFGSAQVEIFGSAQTATLNLRNSVGGAVITNEITTHGSPTILLPDGGLVSLTA